MGHLLGRDCAEVDKEESNLCVVDELVLPLLQVIYAVDDEMPRTDQLNARRAALRQDCPNAFKDHENQFQDVFDHLTQPYAWTDTARRQRVLEHANKLILYIFGERGFTSAHACARARALALLGHASAVQSFPVYTPSRHPVM
jgi:hypothetical protein